jgi:hypothetical protein
MANPIRAPITSGRNSHRTTVLHPACRRKKAAIGGL